MNVWKLPQGNMDQFGIHCDVHVMWMNRPCRTDEADGNTQKVYGTDYFVCRSCYLIARWYFRIEDIDWQRNKKQRPENVRKYVDYQVVFSVLLHHSGWQ